MNQSRVQGDPLFDQVAIGSLLTRNRIVRAGTAETMADGEGHITASLVDLYRRLAANSVGAIITGHMYVTPGGKGAARQVGIDNDEAVDGLRALTNAVHEYDVPIVAQISHAGSQSRVGGLHPIGPSEVPNPLTGQVPREASSSDIEAIVDSFGNAARRAARAGFDGVQVHGANGYLLSEFASPVTNHRTDDWGGSPERRDAMMLAVVSGVRSNLPPGFPVLFKIGLTDAVAGGTRMDESVRRAIRLVDSGVDGFEVSCGLMGAPSDSAAEYVGVQRWRAMRDLIPPGRLSLGVPESTFRRPSRILKSAVTVPVILTGGVRRVTTMRTLVDTGIADLIGMARPFVRQPDLVARIQSGNLDMTDCTSCNLCLAHSGIDPLQCWRTPRRRLLVHAWLRWARSRHT
jgi:2,4-dienoyl-CoA reductase-like NADH-dependent reductase (Old Yellow Enzyme family)